MFNHEWKNRIKLLEIKVAKLGQEKECVMGNHQWEILKPASGSYPLIHCAHCYAPPKGGK